MRVIFIYPETEYLGIEYLSAVLKEHGHITDLVLDPCLFNESVLYIPTLSKIFSYKKSVIKQIVKSKPDLVAFSVISDRYGWACELASQIKSRISVPVVFGGIHPTSVPEIVIKNNFVDFAIVGEGEYALLDLVHALEKKDKDYPIPNVWYKKNGQIIKNDLRPLIQNLDEIPFPDKELFYREPPFKYSPSYSIITARGCPCTCSYCNNDFLKLLYKNKGRYLRRRSVGNVIEELKIAKYKYKKSNIVFDDELFTYDLKWLKDFSIQYKREVDLPSFCWIHPKSVNEEIVSYLKLISCNEVEMGVQTLNLRTQKEILNRPIVSEEQIKKTINLLKASDILITTDNIIGLPGENDEDYIKLLKFYNETRPGRVRIFYLRYYPKTSIIDKSNLDKEKVREIESGLEGRPFTIKGHVFNKTLAKFRLAFLLIHLAPKKLVDFIIDKKIFKLFPAVNFSAPGVLIPELLRYFKKKSKLKGKMRYHRKYRYYIAKIFIGERN